MTKTGQLYGVGLGPGDPDLITLKALKAIETSHIIAYHQAPGKISNALTIAQQFLRPDHRLLPLIYPLTTENVTRDTYDFALNNFYQNMTEKLAALLDAGNKISVLVAGDPLLYSSFMYIYDRLGTDYDTTIIPGVTSIAGAAAALKLPLCYRDQNLTILSAVQEEDTLKNQLLQGDAFAIIKLGRNFSKIRRLLQQTNLAGRAHYIERATMERQKIVPLDAVNDDEVPYFSMILVGGKCEGQS